MLLLQPQQRKNVPFVIRVPYSKIVPNNPVFSHSVAWKAKQPQPMKSSKEDSEQSQQQQEQEQPQQSDLEVSQFHSQDTNGQVVFGFNSPDQMRIETRNADGTVHGTYSYLDPYGQIIKVSETWVSLILHSTRLSLFFMSSIMVKLENL